MSNFTSFVDYDSEQKPSIAVSNHLAPSPIPSHYESPKTIDFLPNEIESYSCENVSFSMQFGESEQGRVVCTKVRLRFLPVVKRERELPQRSRFFDDFYDVPLTAIAKIEVAIVKSEDLEEEDEKEPEKLSEKVVGIGWRMYENWMSWGSGKGKYDKFQRMEYNMSSMETVSMIRLILKDMRVVTVDLRRSQNGTALANQLLFFSKTGSIDKMVQCGAAMEDRGQKAKTPYNGYDAWHSELQRCNQKADSSSPWNILALHKEGFNYVAQGYPMYVVVSNYLTRTDIERQLQNFKQGRFPIWVWSRASGSASLLISAEHENNVATPEILGKIHESLARSSGDQSTDKPHVMKMDSDFVTSVGKAFDNLISLCAIDSDEQYVSREHTWHLKLHRTGWTHLVKNTLSTTFEAIRWIVDRNRTLILQEEDGRDLSIVVASLVQICCDPFYRTTTGFQQLIDKMWIAMGHPFGERLLGRDDDVARPGKTPSKQGSEKTDVAPTWLLFLDCVAQMHRIYQFEFTFSHHVLIALWDLALTGMVPAMTCNNLEEQLVSRVGGGPFPLDRYYCKDYSRMFGNIWHDSVLFLESLKSRAPLSGATSQFLQCETIRPPTSFCEILLWNECFLRWILPANGKNMGGPSEELALDEKMMEIGKRLRSSEWKRHLDLPEEFSSAYPYSIPEISRPVKDFSETMDSERPDTLDNVSITSSTFNSFSFVQTPNLNSTFGSDTGTISSMRPAEQAVSFRKSSPRENFRQDPVRNHSATVATSSQETPILGTSELTSTPVRRANTVRTDYRPVPPPRPAILRVRVDPDENGPQVTRF